MAQKKKMTVKKVTSVLVTLLVGVDSDGDIYVATAKGANGKAPERIDISSALSDLRYDLPSEQASLVRAYSIELPIPDELPEQEALAKAGPYQELTLVPVDLTEFNGKGREDGARKLREDAFGLPPEKKAAKKTAKKKPKKRR